MSFNNPFKKLLMGAMAVSAAAGVPDKASAEDIQTAMCAEQPVSEATLTEIPKGAPAVQTDVPRDTNGMPVGDWTKGGEFQSTPRADRLDKKAE